jgi:dTDP-4-dehydrorhamnose reductase
LRILLTGSTGQVGSALYAPLMTLGEVIISDRTAIDLSQPDLIASALDVVRPDLIVNPAAYTAVDRAEGERDLVFRVNAEAPREIAHWSARHNVPVVHFSTDYVFDGSGTRPWGEGDQTGPLSVYGLSKLAGEIAVKESGSEHLIIRTSWIFAAQGENFLTRVLRSARAHAELRVVGDQFGAPTSAKIIAQAVLETLCNDPRKIAGRFKALDGLVHMCASGEASRYDFALAIVDQLHRRGAKIALENIVAIETKNYPTRAERPRNSRLDISRLRTVLGIEMPDWRAGVDQEVERLCNLGNA